MAEPCRKSQIYAMKKKMNDIFMSCTGQMDVYCHVLPKITICVEPICFFFHSCNETATLIESLVKHKWKAGIQQMLLIWCLSLCLLCVNPGQKLCKGSSSLSKERFFDVVPKGKCKRWVQSLGVHIRFKRSVDFYLDFLLLFYYIHSTFG